MGSEAYRLTFRLLRREAIKALETAEKPITDEAVAEAMGMNLFGYEEHCRSIVEEAGKARPDP